MPLARTKAAISSSLAHAGPGSRSQALALAAASLEASPAYQRLRAIEPGPEDLEDRVLRIVSGAPLTRRELRLAGVFALGWFAMDGFWFVSTLNHWFGL